MAADGNDNAKTGKNPKAIGIDLGTTYSCVAVYRKGRTKGSPLVTEVLPDEFGHRTIPSWVSFSGNKRVVGYAAKCQGSENPENTVYDAKRLIGRRFDDPTIQEDARLWPFRVVEHDKKLMIEIKDERGNKTTFHPEQISAFVLEKIQTIAKEFLGSQVKDVVITVPAYFNDSQRQATKDAGAIAGLNVLRIINEPTAAAIAYGLNKEESDDNEDEINVLVFDLGGGTFDVSILGIECGLFEVKATSGDTHLGGQDFTNQLVNHFASEYQRKLGADVFEHKILLGRLHEECENVKRQLSASMEASLYLEDLIGKGEFRSKISRARFEMLNEELFQRVLEPVKLALSDAKLKKSDVDEVLLVGGSTRIPKVKSLLSKFFDDKVLRDDVNPDEVVACGAAIHAAILSGDNTDEEDSKLFDTVLSDVAPLSLGIETYGGQMNNVIDRNTKLPVSKKKMYTTYEDFQRVVLVQVYEGERPLTKDNNLLGDFKFTNIQPALRGEPKIEVQFNIDTDGILTVSAEDIKTGKQQNVRIENAKGRLTQEDINRMVEEANKYKDEDQKEMEIVKAKLRLSSTALRMLSLTKNSQVTKGNIDQDDVETIKRTCHAALQWLESNLNESRETYEKKLEDVIRICDPISAKALFIRQKQNKQDEVD